MAAGKQRNPNAKRSNPPLYAIALSFSFNDLWLYQATMSQILPIGNSTASVVNTSNGTRIYYQGVDGAIHELSGTGPVSSGAKYVDRVVLPANQVRRDTPLASAVAAGTGLDQVRFHACKYALLSGTKSPPRSNYTTALRRIKFTNCSCPKEDRVLWMARIT
jgi:hypothetical protein